METFAKALPAMRERTEADLARRGLVRERVLGLRGAACSTSASSGSAASATRRRTRPSASRPCGASTSSVQRRRSPASTTRRRARSTTTRRSPIPLVVPTIKALKDRDGGGHELLAYRRGPQRLGRRQGRRDQRVPEGGHRRRLLGQGLPHLERDRARRRRARRATARSARRRRPASAARPRRPSASPTYLSNTPAVCRKAYIDPRVFDRYDSGETIRASLQRMVAGTRARASSSTASGSSARSCGCSASAAIPHGPPPVDPWDRAKPGGSRSTVDAANVLAIGMCLAASALLVACGNHDAVELDLDRRLVELERGCRAPTSASPTAGDLGQDLIAARRQHGLPVREGHVRRRVDAARAPARTEWPPLTVKGRALAGDGVDAAKLTTLKRDDGSTADRLATAHPL